MLTLSIDTATDRCAVGLWEGGGDGRLRAARDEPMPRGHGEALFGLVGAVLEEAGAAPHDITRLVAISGPGTFTGLRIGLAAIRGLALSLGVPALGVSAFDLVAVADLDATGEARPRTIAIDARRGEIYLRQLDPDLAPLSPPVVLEPAAAARHIDRSAALVIGTGAAQLVDAARGIGIDLKTRDVARHTPAMLARLGAIRDPVLHPAEPLYIRPPDAKEPAANPLLASGA